MNPTEEIYKCPKCNSENVQKASVVFAKGTQNLAAVTVGGGIVSTGEGGGLGGGLGVTSGTSQSLLAQLIAPPVKQDMKGIALIFIACFSLLCVALTPILDLFVQLAIFIPVTTGVIILAVYLNKKECKRYEKEFNKWNLLWFCNRCGNVFIIEDKT